MVKERVTYVREHRPVEKEFVVSVGVWVRVGVGVGRVFDFAAPACAPSRHPPPHPTITPPCLRWRRAPPAWSARRPRGAPPSTWAHRSAWSARPPPARPATERRQRRTSPALPATPPPPHTHTTHQVPRPPRLPPVPSPPPVYRRRASAPAPPPPSPACLCFVGTSPPRPSLCFARRSSVMRERPSVHGVGGAGCRCCTSLAPGPICPQPLTAVPARGPEGASERGAGDTELADHIDRVATRLPPSLHSLIA